MNFGDPVTGQTGDARVGRKLNDHTALSFEVGVPIIKDYPVYNSGSLALASLDRAAGILSRRFRNAHHHGPITKISGAVQVELRALMNSCKHPSLASKAAFVSFP